MKAPKPEPNKVSITIRLRPSTVETYRRTGRGWQTRLSNDLDDLIAGRAPQLAAWRGPQYPYPNRPAKGKK